MSHEVIQVIILAKYIRRSNEIIQVTYKYYWQREIRKWYKSKHSHEMMQFWNWIIICSLLHELVRISELSHRSVFESPVYWVHNEHKFKTPVNESGSHKRVWIAATRIQTQLIRTYTHIYTRTFMHTHMYTSKHTWYIHTHYIHTYPHIHTHAFTQPHIY